MAGRRRTRLRRQRLAPTSLGVRAGGLPEILGFVAGIRRRFGQVRVGGDLLRMYHQPLPVAAYLAGMRKPSA